MLCSLFGIERAQTVKRGVKEGVPTLRPRYEAPKRPIKRTRSTEGRERDRDGLDALQGAERAGARPGEGRRRACKGLNLRQMMIIRNFESEKETIKGRGRG